MKFFRDMPQETKEGLFWIAPSLVVLAAIGLLLLGQSFGAIR